MINLSGKNKYAMIIITVSLLCVLEMGWIMLPMIKKINKINKEITQQKETLLNLLKAGQSVRQNEENLKKIDRKKYIFEQSWLKSGDELRFITDLENVAKTNDLEQVIKFDNTNFTLLDKEIKIVPIELQLNAELANFMDYIVDIEKLDYYINFKSIKITINSQTRANPHQLDIENQEEQNNNKKLSIQLHGETYWK